MATNAALQSAEVAYDHRLEPRVRVGADLQYIRINGTIIGGLIGLAIHQATVWLT